MIYFGESDCYPGTNIPSTKVKEAAHQLIDQLPDEVSWDELAYQIEIRASIERGLADAEAGRLISQEEIERHFNISGSDQSKVLQRHKSLSHTCG